MTYEEAKEIVMAMPEVVAQGEKYVEEFIEGFLEAMNSDDDMPDGGQQPPMGNA